jgi:lipase
MLLNTHRWGAADSECVVCLHGVAQHGGVFEDAGRRLAALGYSVLAVDLRGHGGSGHEPPWNIGTHARDVLETIEAEGVERATWVGHSFGGLVATALATEAAERTRALILLDPGLEVPPDRALRSAEIERLDWSFATVDGALNALLSNESIVVSPREVVTAAKPLFDGSRQHRRYEEELGGLLTKVEVPGGHNVLWESPEETIGAVEGFLEPAGEPAAG